MMDDYSYLSPSVKKVADKSNEERIQFIQNPKWIGYTLANDILNKLDQTFSQRKTHRMKNLLLVGSTNNGKTMIVNSFCRKHPATDDLNADNIVVPVISIQAPPVPDEGRLYNNILEKVFALYNPKEHASIKQMRVINILKEIGTKVLVIDELHHILSDTLNKQRRFLNVLKFLSNELQIPLIGVGTKEALRAIQSDPQLENRFEPVVLPLWRLNNDFKKLLASFEALLPLRKQSTLASNHMASRLHMLCEGTIGELSTILSSAAILAIEQGKEQITIELLDSMKLLSPTDRRKKATSHYL